MSTGVLPDVAVGPSGTMAVPTEKMTTIGLENRDQIIGVNTNKTLTLTLPSSGRDGYEWRFSEIPDPTVLKLVSKEFTPNADPQKAGKQTLVFEGTGTGEVNVKMWYGTLWASRMEEAYIYKFVAAVTPEEVKPAKKQKSRKHVTKA